MAAAEGTGQAAAPPAASRGTSSSVWMLRIFGVIFLILSFVIYLGTISDPDAGGYTIGIVVMLAGVGLGAVGILVGNIQLSKKFDFMVLNLVLLVIAIILLVAGAILMGNRIDTGESIPPVQIIFVLFYGFFTLSFIELSHASYRFTNIDEYNRTHELKGFTMSGVVNNYFTWFFILMGLIFVISLLIISTHYGVLMMVNATNEVFGASVELNSIYVFAISVAIWFIPLGIFAAIIFGEGSLIKSTQTILVKPEKAPGEEMMGLQTIERPEDMAK